MPLPGESLLAMTVGAFPIKRCNGLIVIACLHERPITDIKVTAVDMQALEIAAQACLWHISTVSDHSLSMTLDESHVCCQIDLGFKQWRYSILFTHFRLQYAIAVVPAHINSDQSA